MTGSNLCAFNKENPPETRKGWPSQENFLARLAQLFLLLVLGPYTVFAVVWPFRSLPHPVPWFCDPRKQF